MAVQCFFQEKIKYETENHAIWTLVQALGEKFFDNDINVYLGANIAFKDIGGNDIQIDVLIIMDGSIALLELKEWHHGLNGKLRGIWHKMYGNSMAQYGRLGGGSSTNPFIQVERARKALIAKLENCLQLEYEARYKNKLEEIVNDLKGVVVLSPKKLPNTHIEGKRPTWFELLGLDEVADLVFKIAPGKAVSFKQEEIEFIIREIFECKEWHSLESVLPKICAGHLYLLEGGEKSNTGWTVIDHLNIGRSGGNDIPIPEKYGYTSKKHAQIQVFAGHAFIKDGVAGNDPLKSRYGTFLLRNNNKLSIDWKGIELEDSDVLILGEPPADQDAQDQICRLEFISSKREPGATKATLQ